jgi:hypothetical protein
VLLVVEVLSLVLLDHERRVVLQVLLVHSCASHEKKQVSGLRSNHKPLVTKVVVPMPSRLPLTHSPE